MHRVINLLPMCIINFQFLSQKYIIWLVHLSCRWCDAYMTSMSIFCWLGRLQKNYGQHQFFRRLKIKIKIINPYCIINNHNYVNIWSGCKAGHSGPYYFGRSSLSTDYRLCPMWSVVWRSVDGKIIHQSIEFTTDLKCTLTFWIYNRLT